MLCQFILCWEVSVHPVLSCVNSSYIELCQFILCWVVSVHPVLSGVNSSCVELWQFILCWVVTIHPVLCQFILCWAVSVHPVLNCVNSSCVESCQFILYWVVSIHPVLSCVNSSCADGRKLQGRAVTTCTDHCPPLRCAKPQQCGFLCVRKTSGALWVIIQSCTQLETKEARTETARAYPFHPLRDRNTSKHLCQTARTALPALPFARGWTKWRLRNQRGSSVGST